MNQVFINFLKVDIDDESHHRILYKILKSRKYNISNDNKFNYEEHKDFVLKNPYHKWYLILNNKEILGSFYITFDNNIGISLISEEKYFYKEIITQIVSIHKPNPGIKSVRSKYFTFNVNPENHKIQEVFKELGFKKIQTTYAII